LDRNHKELITMLPLCLAGAVAVIAPPTAGMLASPDDVPVEDEWAVDKLDPMRAGCSGISPSTGVRWSYVEPQHTATGTVVRYLKDRLNVSSCHHGHTTWHPSDVTTSFAFVANPFARVLTSAAYHGAVGGNETAQRQVSSFRTWVRQQPQPPIYGQKALHSHFPNLWVGRIESLASDLETVLARLGYTVPESPIVFERVHCITSCSARTDEHVSPTGPHHHVDLPEAVRWYDEPTRRHVVEWFADDFAAFNFSTTPPSALSGWTAWL
jgi:hypothetical protein